jgi:hypothetical protein
MKGKEIRFIGGKYVGLKGWINVSKTPGYNTIPVIADTKKKGEWETYVFLYNIEDEPQTPPTSYAAAVLQACPDLDGALTKICRDFAKCDIRRDYDGFYKIMGKKLGDAAKLQDDKGSKALYRHIDFDDGIWA